MKTNHASTSFAYLTSTQSTNRRYTQPLAAAFALVCVLTGSSWVNADTESDIRERSVEAMENFDLLEFDEAKRLLEDAVKIAKKKKMRDPLVATVFVNLGVVYFSGFEDPEKAKLQFIEAVEIDSTVDIDPAYRTNAMAKLMTETKSEFGSDSSSDPVPTGDDDDDDDVDCGDVEGLAHELIEEVAAGKPARIVAHLGADTAAKAVHLFYRAKGSVDFEDVPMKRNGDCGFSADIPASALSSDIVHYYVAALSKSGKRVANRGSSGSPNIIEVQASVTGGGFGDTDDENPLGGSGNKTTVDIGDDPDTGGSVSKVGPIGSAGNPKLFLAVAAGSGAGYVSGETEQVKSPVGCCVAPALLHVLPELGYYLNSRLAVAIAFRIGFPVSANRPGHATAAPAGLLRIHYSLQPDGGDGLAVVGAIGGGLIRHTVKIDDQAPDMNVDTTASGPLLLGAGLNYLRSLSGPMKVVLGLNATAGVPIGVELQGVSPGFALQIDANLGVLFAF